MKAVVTVTGKDSMGIIAKVSALCTEYDTNIVDISQTVMQEYFTMIMLVDFAACASDFAALESELKALGEEKGLSVRIQREDIFNAIHKI